MTKSTLYSLDTESKECFVLLLYKGMSIVQPQHLGPLGLLPHT
jgi:hypothetical protein